MPVDPLADGETILLYAGAAIVIQIGIPTLLFLYDEDRLLNFPCPQGSVVRDSYASLYAFVCCDYLNTSAIRILSWMGSYGHFSCKRSLAYSNLCLACNQDHTYMWFTTLISIGCWGISFPIWPKDCRCHGADNWGFPQLGLWHAGMLEDELPCFVAHDLI